MRHQADECLSPASLTNTHSEHPSPQNYPFSMDEDNDDLLRPKFATESLMRLAELSSAQCTLSPFTASIPQSVFRSSVGLIAALRPRRREFVVIKASETEPAFQRATEFSPPESVMSAQSNASRPSLFSTRQRPSYLRRPHPPKRKVIRLGQSPVNSTRDDESIAQSETSEGIDYFSESAPYQNAYQRECEEKWKTEATLREALWNGTFPKAWDGEMDKGNEHPWTNDA